MTRKAAQKAILIAAGILTVVAFVLLNVAAVIAILDSDVTVQLGLARTGALLIGDCVVLFIAWTCPAWDSSGHPESRP